MKILFSSLFIGVLIYIGYLWKYSDPLEKYVSSGHSMSKKLKLASTDLVNHSLNIEVRIIDQKYCWVGDMDIISQDLNFKNEKDFTLSVESLTRPGKVSQQKVSYDYLSKQGSANFKVDLSTFDTIDSLGLFLCSNPKSSCSDISAIDPVKIYKAYTEEVKVLEPDPNPDYKIKVRTRYNQDKKKIEGMAQRDNVYFYGHLFRVADKVSYPKISDKVLSKPKHYMNTMYNFETKILKKNSISQAKFTEAAKTLSVLQNLPLSSAENKVVIELPKRIKRCYIPETAPLWQDNKKNQK